MKKELSPYAKIVKKFGVPKELAQALVKRYLKKHGYPLRLYVFPMWYDLRPRMLAYAYFSDGFEAVLEKRGKRWYVLMKGYKK